MIQVEIAGRELVATIRALVLIVLIDIPPGELDLVLRIILIPGEPDHIGDGNTGIDGLYKAARMGMHHFRKLMPVVEIVSPIVLVYSLSVTLVDKRQGVLP